MATLTRLQMADLVLERLGVKAAGVAASSRQVTTACQAVDAVHAELWRLAPFPTSAFPEEAQLPFADIAAKELLVSFGIGGERAAEIRESARMGRKKLARAYASEKQRPVRGHYF